MPKYHHTHHHPTTQGAMLGFLKWGRLGWWHGASTTLLPKQGHLCTNASQVKTGSSRQGELVFSNHRCTVRDGTAPSSVPEDHTWKQQYNNCKFLFLLHFWDQVN